MSTDPLTLWGVTCFLAGVLAVAGFCLWKAMVAAERRGD